jgi:putative membrane protein
MRKSLKALTLIALALFLYSRLYNGTLLFYINRRFAWLTLLAATGFLLVAISYRYRPAHPHQHNGHHHTASWDGLLLVVLTVILGLFIPPKPLGATAMETREVSVGSLAPAMSPGSSAELMTTGEKDILGWLIDFQRIRDPAASAGQEAHVIGFVYRDDRFEAETFMVSRFVVTCCVADASAAGLIVRWPQTASLDEDQWVEVSGHFEPGEFYGQRVPILIADKITPTDPPNQPYLYY